MINELRPQDLAIELDELRKQFRKRLHAGKMGKHDKIAKRLHQVEAKLRHIDQCEKSQKWINFQFGGLLSS